MKLCADPGHGGSDQGGSGYGKQEKNVVLDIAYAIVRQAIDRGHQVILTRTRDVNVALDTRYEIANRWGADVFMSVHTNASGGRGLEVLYGKENAKQFALDLVDTLHDATGWPIRRGNGLWYRPGVAVLRGTNMPAVLSECGFIDYLEESAAMSNPAWIERVAKAHIDAACRFLGVEDETEEEEMKLYAQDTGMKSPDGWTIYNVPSVDRNWWLDISNEHDGPVKVRAYFNAQSKPTQTGGYFEAVVPNTRADAPGMHKQVAELCPGISLWTEMSLHAEKPLSILVGN
jgi:N-acetylmuramoyl-L-alanine amidase